MSGRETPSGQVENLPEKASGGLNALPKHVEDLLLALNPRQAKAVRLYTTRGSPAFGNKYKAALLAGYSESYAYDGRRIFGRPDVAEAVRAMRKLDLGEAEDVMESMKALAPDARDELMSQLDLGRALEVIDPTEIFGEKLENVQSEHDEVRLREINKHNKNIAHLMKERRAAAMDLLAYGEGPPEQRMRVTRGSSEGDKLMELMAELPQDRFEEIGRALFGKDAPDPDESEPEVIDVEVLED